MKKLALRGPSAGLRAVRETYEERLRNYTLFSDPFFAYTFNDKACMEQLVRRLMGDASLAVEDVRIQDFMPNLVGHATRMDVVATVKRGTDGILFDIEVQQEPEGADPTRARLYAGRLDLEALPEGGDYREAKKSIVAFLTKTDVLKMGRGLYRIERCITNVGGAKAFGDGSVIYYANPEYERDSLIGRFLQDFFHKNPEDIQNPVVRERACFLKNRPEGKEIMYTGMDSLYLEGVAKGEARGKAENQREVIINMLADGETAEKAARYTKLSLAEVMGIKAEYERGASRL